MIALQYVLLWVLAMGASYVWAVQEQSVPISSVAAASCWIVLAIEGGSIELYADNVASSQLVGSPTLQYLSAAFAILSMVALVLWFFDEYPATNRTEQGAT